MPGMHPLMTAQTSRMQMGKEESWSRSMGILGTRADEEGGEG